MNKTPDKQIHENELLKQYQTKNNDCWQFVTDCFGGEMWECDLKNKIIEFSEHCLKPAGYGRNRTSRTIETWMEIIHPEDLPKVKKNLKKHLTGKSPFFQCDYRIPSATKGYTWLHNRGKVVSFETDGKPKRMIGLSIDMTLQKKLEKSLKVNLQKERELNKLKSQFVSMASHEFRTPLTTMLVIADTLLSYHDQMSKEEMCTNIKTIRTNLLFLKKVIEKTLSFTQYESGKLSIFPVAVELNEFIEEVIGKLPDIDKQRIIFYRNEMAVNVKTDKQVLNEVLINLLLNGLKYSKADKPVELEITDKDNLVKIKIIDKGVGIPEQDKDYIFDAFRRGSNVKSIRGTGLGLAIAREFIRAQGGNIKFKSKVNKGSTFYIILPH